MAYLLLDGVGQAIGLARAVDRKRVVLERVELRHGVEPGGVGKGGQQGRHGLEPGEAGKAGHPDHRGDQYQPIRFCQRAARVGQRIERIFHRQRTAVGKAHQMQRPLARCQQSGLPHRQSGGGQPGLPIHIHEAGWHGAVAGDPQPQRDKALLLIASGQMAQAIGGVGQAVQQHRHPFDFPLGAQQVGAVPVLLKAGGIDGGVLIVAIAGQLLLRRRLGDHLGGHQLEQLCFAGQIGLPVAAVELIGTEFGGHHCVPQLQRRCLPGEVGDHRPCGQQQQQQGQQSTANKAASVSQHGAILGDRGGVSQAQKKC